jgi:4-amino-4-deoxy-L-arabinose transferase-like glycosyltransferase
VARARGTLATFRGRLGLIVAIGLVLRLLYALVWVKKQVLLGDAHEFDLLAHDLVHGHGYVDPFLLKEGIVRPTAFKPPGYPFALAAVTALGGGGYVAHHVLTCLFGAVTVLLIGLIGRRVGGDRLGLVAAGIAAAYPMLIAFDGSLRSESLYAMLVAGAVWAALRVAERPSVLRGVVLGAFVGLAALTRTEALLLLVLLALPLAWRRAPALRVVAVAVVTAVVVIAPWTIRNVTTFHHPVLISTNDGGVFRGANCHRAYYGPGIGFWFFECFPPSTGGRPSAAVAYNEVEAANEQRTQGLRYARHHAARGVAVMGVRVLRTWDLFQPRRQAALASVLEGRPLRFEQAGIAVYLVLLVLAVAGAVSLRRRPRVLAVLLAPALLVTLSSAISYGFTRFRAGAEPMVVLLAAVALLALADRVRERRSASTS